MGKDLAVIKPDKFPALVPNSDVREAMLANAAGEPMQISELTRIPTPAGGATKWTIDTIAGEETADELVGLMVAYAPYGVLWPSEEPAENAMPVLVTTDLIHAKRVNTELGDIDGRELEKHRLPNGLYDWVNLPWNQFGTGKNGIGKRCKESRLLAILREGEAWPFVIHAMPGSLRDVKAFVKKLPLPYFRCIVGLKLQSAKSRGGQKYSQIVPRLIGTVDRETGAAVQQLYTNSLRRAIEGITAGAAPMEEETQEV